MAQAEQFSTHIEVADMLEIMAVVGAISLVLLGIIYKYGDSIAHMLIMNVVKHIPYEHLRREKERELCADWDCEKNVFFKVYQSLDLYIHKEDFLKEFLINFTKSTDNIKIKNYTYKYRLKLSSVLLLMSGFILGLGLASELAVELFLALADVFKSLLTPVILLGLVLKLALELMLRSVSELRLALILGLLSGLILGSGFGLISIPGLTTGTVVALLLALEIGLWHVISSVLVLAIGLGLIFASRLLLLGVIQVSELGVNLKMISSTVLGVVSDLEAALVLVLILGLFKKSIQKVKRIS